MYGRRGLLAVIFFAHIYEARMQCEGRLLAIYVHDALIYCHAERKT